MKLTCKIFTILLWVRHILLTQFLMDILVNIVLFEVGHFPVHLGTLGAGVRDDCWHLWVEEGFQCLGHYV